MHQHVLDRAKLLQQLAGRLLADAGHAGHVVHAVADQHLEVDHLLRRDAPFPLQRIAVEDLLLAQVVDLDAVRQELPAVLVVAANEHVQAAGRPGAGERGNHVVGLEALDAQDGQAQGRQHLVDQRDLGTHRIGHRAALGLVGRVDAVAERLARWVKHDDQVARLAVLAQKEHVAGEAEQRVGRQPAGAAHFRDRVEHLEEQRVGVNEIQPLGGNAWGHGTSRVGRSALRSFAGSDWRQGRRSEIGCEPRRPSGGLHSSREPRSSGQCASKRDLVGAAVWTAIPVSFLHSRRPAGPVKAPCQARVSRSSQPAQAARPSPGAESARLAQPIPLTAFAATLH